MILSAFLVLVSPGCKALTPTPRKNPKNTTVVTVQKATTVTNACAPHPALCGGLGLLWQYSQGTGRPSPTLQGTEGQTAWSLAAEQVSQIQSKK